MKSGLFQTPQSPENTLLMADGCGLWVSVGQVFQLFLGFGNQAPLSTAPPAQPSSWSPGPSLVANTPELPRPVEPPISVGHTQNFRPLGSAGGSVYNVYTAPEQPELASWGSEGCHLPAPPPRGTVGGAAPGGLTANAQRGSGLFLS